MDNKEIIDAVALKEGSIKKLAERLGCDQSELYRIRQGNRKGTEIMLQLVMMYPKYKKEFLGGFSGTNNKA